MAANTTAISFLATAPAKPSTSISHSSLAGATVKVAVVLVVAAMAWSSAARAVEMAQAVFAPVVDGALIVLSRPMLPLGF